MTFAEKIADLLRNDLPGKAFELAEKQVLLEVLNENPSNKKRYLAAKKILAKADEYPKYLTGVWYDDRGRQCFTDTKVVFRLTSPIKYLPELADNIVHPEIERVFGEEKYARKTLRLCEEEIKKHIAHGRVYKDRYFSAGEAKERIGKEIINISGVYLSAYLFSMALQILGSAPVIAQPSALLGGEGIHLSCDNGEAVVAYMRVNENEKGANDND